MTQPQRRRSTRTILIVVGIVLVVGCLIAVVVGFFGIRALNTAAEPPRAATEAFLRDLSNGDAAAAYGKLCQPTRSRTSQAQVATIMSSRRPTSYRIVDVAIQNVNGEVSAAVTADLTYPDGFTSPHVFRLRKENDVWKVCGNPY